ncbi:cellulase family glycosylhydrolase [Williamsia maris]|uniref:Cellulase (Glycosyl hydrolase family 5) n=1 Tax=Williamsia maris TaxID=72806 RepID=A0ABT1HCT2_9NOCA|nr:cellulase family glycosylhydrolase [Williamsia maris]MCP2174691.1 Cellulase (glycosyl hydrolase family 5) [Williamsia maris]
MSNRPSRPFPFAKTVVSLTAVTVFATVAGQALVPHVRPVYDIVNAAAITVAPDTVGIADSDLYFASPEQVQRTLDAMQSLGVTNVRVLIPWYDVNPDPGVYDWSKIDRVIAAAQARNMGVLAVITHSPDWAVTPGDTPVISPPAREADFGDFTALVAQRYSGRISAYEIWNEPNGASSFYPAPDPVRYTALLKDAYTKIKAVDPSVTVIAGVLGAVPTRPEEGTVDSPSFLEAMYEAGAKDYFDAISFHPYQYSTPYSQGPSLTGSPINEVREMRALMVSQGDAAKLIWASEYGLPTSVVSEAQQAAYIKDFLAGWSAQGYAGPMFVYTTRDASGEFESTLNFGVFREDWTAKPAAQVIKDFIAAHPQIAPSPTPNLVELVIRSMTRLMQSFAVTVQQFVRSLVAAITAVFAPPAPRTVTTIALAAARSVPTTSPAPTSSQVAATETTTAEAPASSTPRSDAAASTEQTSTAAPSSTTSTRSTTSTPSSTTPTSTTTTPTTTASTSTGPAPTSPQSIADTPSTADEARPVATAGAVS